MYRLQSAGKTGAGGLALLVLRYGGQRQGIGLLRNGGTAWHVERIGRHGADNVAHAKVVLYRRDCCLDVGSAQATACSAGTLVGQLVERSEGQVVDAPRGARKCAMQGRGQWHGGPGGFVHIRSVLGLHQYRAGIAAKVDVVVARCVGSGTGSDLCSLEATACDGVGANGGTVQWPFAGKAAQHSGVRPAACANTATAAAACCQNKRQGGDTASQNRSFEHGWQVGRVADGDAGFVAQEVLHGMGSI